MRTILATRAPHPLNLIEYGDFSCPRCRDLQQLLITTLPLFEGEVRYTFRHFPTLSRPQGVLMALAAEAARRQDQYWAMHRALFAHTSLVPISLSAVSALACRLGLDPELFLTDMHDKILKQRIWTDVEQGRLDGVVSTPTLFLGIRRLHGKLTQARLVPLIRHCLDRSNANVLSMVDHERGLVRWSTMGYPSGRQLVVNEGVMSPIINREIIQKETLSTHQKDGTCGSKTTLLAALANKKIV
jgi:hypothetical protein